MSKGLKLLFLLITILIFSSCKKEYKNENINSIDEVEYPTFTISEYNKMDKYELIKTIDGVEYKYTYFFNDDMCVNAKEELKFASSEKAETFYNEKKDSDEYLDLDLKNNLVTYFYNPEYFEYMMYPKDILLELLNSIADDE